MKIAISNIAWEHSEDTTIATILQKYNIQGIEIAPTKIWTDPTNVTNDDAKAYKHFWKTQGIAIVAMQSLLFGHPELALFENAVSRKNLLNYLKKIINLASILGVKAMVFGSPKNRQKGKLDEKTAQEIACGFFTAVGSVAKQYDINFCIETNPKVYGTDFLTTTDEVIKFIKIVNHPNINVHLDTGAMEVNNEDYESTIITSLPFFHFHISEPNLSPVPQTVNHAQVAAVLRKINYDKWVSIEMRAEQSANSTQINKTLDFVTKTYR